MFKIAEKNIRGGECLCGEEWKVEGVCHVDKEHPRIPPIHQPSSSSVTAIKPNSPPSNCFHWPWVNQERSGQHLSSCRRQEKKKEKKASKPPKIPCFHFNLFKFCFIFHNFLFIFFFLQLKIIYVSTLDMTREFAIHNITQQTSDFPNQKNVSLSPKRKICDNLFQCRFKDQLTFYFAIISAIPLRSKSKWAHLLPPTESSIS